MKKRGVLRIFSFIMAVFVLCTAVNLPTEAATAKQKVKTKTIKKSKFKKVRNSVKTESIMETAYAKKYAAMLKGSEDTMYSEANTLPTLLITSNGKTFTKVDLEKVICEKLGLTSTHYILLNQLTCIKNKFYITGEYTEETGWDPNATPFVISTTNGKSVTVEKMDLKLNPGSMVQLKWNLYYSNGYYVAANHYMESSYVYTEDDAMEEKPYFYISKDAKTWKKSYLTHTLEPEDRNDYRSNSFSVVEAASKGFVVREHLKADHAWDEDMKQAQEKLFVTTDFKTYKPIKTLNDAYKISGTVGAKSRSASIIDVQMSDKSQGAATVQISKTDDGGDTYYSDSLVLYRSNGVNKYKKAITINGKWDYYCWYTRAASNGKWGQFSFYIKKGKTNTLYIANTFTGKFKKYSSKLDVSKMNLGVEYSKWVYNLYDGKYILASKDGGKTTYKIKTGFNNISSLNVIGSNVIITVENGYDYYIPIKTIQKVTGK